MENTTNCDAPPSAADNMRLSPPRIPRLGGQGSGGDLLGRIEAGSASAASEPDLYDMTQYEAAVRSGMPVIPFDIGPLDIGPLDNAGADMPGYDPMSELGSTMTSVPRLPPSSTSEFGSTMTSTDSPAKKKTRKSRGGGTPGSDTSTVYPLGLGGIAENPPGEPASKKKGVGKEPRKKWGDAELQQLFALVDEHGNRWKTIVKEMEGFTVDQVRHHGRKYLDEKKERKENLLKVSGMCLQTLQFSVCR